MKTQIFKSLLFIGVMAASYTWCMAHPDYEERKQVNKSYQVNPNTSVSFTNSFGKLQVNTWDKNELQVNIEIITRSSNESRAKDMLDRISIAIDDSNPSSSVAFKTVISNTKSNGNNSMEINYIVYMPKNNPIYLRNSFGDCFLANYNGKVTIKESYGNLNTENLGGDNDVDLSFGGGTSKIDGFKSGDLKVSYSNLEIGVMGTANINAQFSNLQVDKLSEATLVAKYGQVNLGEVGSLEANVNFSSFEIDKLNRKLDLDIDYGGKTDIGHISKDIQSIEIHSSFGPVRLDLPLGLNAGINIKVEFGGFGYDKKDIDFNKVYEGNTSKEYEGRVGKGSSSVMISVTCKYGDVKINQD